MRYFLTDKKITRTVEIVQESEKFITFREFDEQGGITEFRKKKPVSLTPCPRLGNEVVDFNYWITEPFQHQRETLEYAKHSDNFLILDEPGLGKTKQALDIIMNRKRNNQIKRSLIIVCVGQLQYTWLAQTKVHTDLKGYILGTRPAKKNSIATKIGSNADKLYDLQHCHADILICNIEALRNEPIVKQLQKMIYEGDIGQIVVDEVHKCKNANAQQSAGLFALHPPYKLGLTGTPIINTPLDLWSIAHWLGTDLRCYSDFKSMYCEMGGFKDKEVVGYKNLDDLAMRLGTYSLRRLKSQCIDLPSKTCYTLYVDLYAKQKQLYNDILKDIRDRPEDILALPTPMGRFIGLRKATSCPNEVQEGYSPYECAKAQELLRIIQEAIANNQKVVVYTWFVFTLKYLNTFLRSQGIIPALIYGEMQVEERVMNERAFQNNPECKVIIGNYQTMGTGIELTAASFVVEYELPWTAADEIQGQDRCHRIGQYKNLTCIRLITNYTVDVQVENIVNTKAMLKDSIVDREVMRKIITEILKPVD